MDEVDPQFVCPVCREVLRQPVVINSCQHRFCSDCLARLPPSGSGSSLCPICRTPFTAHDRLRDYGFERVIALTSTVCSGCRQQLPLAHYNDHCAACPMRNMTTPTFQPVAQTSQHVSAGPNRSTFNCPFCSQDNLDCKGLVEHVDKYHSSCRTPAVCPVCASMPWGNPHQQSQNFVQHLKLRHCFEYDTYVDYDQDDDASLQAALQASMRDH